MDGHKDTLLFIDPCCPRPYDPVTIDGPGLGGTEQTMVTLAEGLAATGLFNVVVEQHNRLEGEDYAGKALYTYTGSCRKARWVVVLRDQSVLPAVRGAHPQAKLYLFSHDLPGRELGRDYSGGVFKASNTLAVVCVSSWHRTQTIEVLRAFGYTGEFRVRSIYNPLSEDVVRTDVPYDKNKLIWLASPHKGLDRAYELLGELRKQNNAFRLYVTNPGYYPNQEAMGSISDYVVNLGTISHAKVTLELSNSLCLFYPNQVFPETFGKIMAEANAMGVPVLTSPLGASREVLDSHPEQVLDTRDAQAVVERVMKWWGGARPIVRGNPRFKLSNVVQEWVRLLNDIR